MEICLVIMQILQVENQKYQNQNGEIYLKVYDKNNNKNNVAIKPNSIEIGEDSSYSVNEAGYLISMGIAEGNGKFGNIRLVDESVSSETKIDAFGISTPLLRIWDGGTCMYGKDTGHKYKCNWTGSQLQFFVDVTNVGTLSDKRLKTEIQDIDDDFIKIIDEVEMKQFKVANRNGLISFGILAQDLMEIFGKYNKNPFDYEIVQKTQYKIDDETIYYTINYEQFLILKQKSTDIKLQKQQEQIDTLLKEIQELKGVNNGED